MTLYANNEQPLILSVPVYTFLKSKILYHQNTSLKPDMCFILVSFTCIIKDINLVTYAILKQLSRKK